MVNRARLQDMLARAARPANEEPCPLCGGPSNHGGRCVDEEGYVHPAYAALAEEWEASGRPRLGDEDLADLEEIFEQAEDEHRQP